MTWRGRIGWIGWLVAVAVVCAGCDPRSVAQGGASTTASSASSATDASPTEPSTHEAEPPDEQGAVPVTDYTVEYGVDVHGAILQPGDTVFIDHTGQVELMTSGKDERAGIPVVARAEPSMLAELTRLISAPTTRALESVPPRGEGKKTVLAIRTPGWDRQLSFAKVPPEAEPLLRAIVALGEHARTHGTPVTPLRDYVLTLRRENRGGRLRRYGTLTVRANGDIELAPPHAEAIRARVEPADLVGLGLLLASPGVQKTRCRNQPTEGFYWIANVTSPDLELELRCVSPLSRHAWKLDQALWRIRNEAGLPKD